jgi:ribosomal protein S18 acetylase RimI-like enzyme
VIKIRLLTSDDAAAYQKLRLIALSHDPDAFLSTLDQEQDWPVQRYSTELWYAQTEAPFGYYGAFYEDALVGYIRILSTGLQKQKHAAFLYNLYVSPEHRHQKIASSMLEHILKRLREADIEYLYLSCVSSNAQALAFYHQSGFIEVGRQPKAIKWNGQYFDHMELYREV